MLYTPNLSIHSKTPQLINLKDFLKFSLLFDDVAQKQQKATPRDRHREVVA